MCEVEEPVEIKELLESTLLDFYRNYLDLNSNDDITIQIHKYIEGKYREEESDPMDDFNYVGSKYHY